MYNKRSLSLGGHKVLQIVEAYIFMKDRDQYSKGVCLGETCLKSEEFGGCKCSSHFYQAIYTHILTSLPNAGVPIWPFWELNIWAHYTTD